MNRQLSLSDEARARTTDPWTSWCAARSVHNVRESQAAVLHLITLYGPMSLSQLVGVYQRKQSILPVQSESGIRSRCAELVAKDLVEVCGHRTNSSGRKERLLRHVPQGETATTKASERFL
jgi:hypothetical protein